MKLASHIGLLELYLLHCNFLLPYMFLFSLQMNADRKAVFYICFVSDLFVCFVSACRVVEILKVENMMNIQI